MADTFWTGGHKYPHDDWRWEGTDTIINTTMLLRGNLFPTSYNGSSLCLAMCTNYANTHARDDEKDSDYDYELVRAVSLNDLCFMGLNCTETIDWRDGSPIGFICEQKPRSIYTNSWSMRQRRPQDDDRKVVDDGDEGSGDYNP